MRVLFLRMRDVGRPWYPWIGLVIHSLGGEGGAEVVSFVTTTRLGRTDPKPTLRGSGR